MERGLTLTVEHLPGVDKCVADAESQVIYDPVISRVGASQGCVSESDAECMPTQCGSLCNTPKLPVTSVCQLEARPICDQNRCTLDTMVEMEG